MNVLVAEMRVADYSLKTRLKADRTGLETANAPTGLAGITISDVASLGDKLRRNAGELEWPRSSWAVLPKLPRPSRLP